jgi:hypothetical protein
VNRLTRVFETAAVSTTGAALVLLAAASWLHFAFNPGTQQDPNWESVLFVACSCVASLSFSLALAGNPDQLSIRATLIIARLSAFCSILFFGWLTALFFEPAGIRRTASMIVSSSGGGVAAVATMCGLEIRAIRVSELRIPLTVVTSLIPLCFCAVHLALVAPSN